MYTPSKVRKIKVTEVEKKERKDEILKFYQARSMTMPVKVNAKDVIFFFNFLAGRLEELKSGFYERIEELQELPETQTSKGHIVKKFTFNYNITSKDQKTIIKNEIVCSKNPDEDYYRVQLASNLDNLEVSEEKIFRIAEIVRGISLDWLKNRDSIVG
jgi:bisphosphoglycerate-independent phosphoglycerate mutase (AlkP superfamily)